MPPLRLALGTLVALVLLALAPRAFAAQTLQAPAGGKAVPLPEGLVACGAAGEWAVEAEGKAVRPPASDTAIGHVAQLKVAPNASGCATSTTTIELVATARLPQIDPGSIALSVDEGRLDLRGHGLRGVGVHWQQGDRGGDDRCAQPETQGGGGAGLQGPLDRCSFAVTRGLPADPNAAGISWFPAGGRAAGPDVATFDATGRRTTDSEMLLRPARVLLTSVVPANVAIDLAGDAPRIPLAHPEAIASVDCGAAICDIDAGAIRVQSMHNLGQALALRVHLAPHVFFARGDVLDGSPGFNVAVLPCAISVASGDALRGVEDSSVVLKLDARCAAEASSLRYVVGSQTARVLRVATDGGAAYVLLRVGRLEGDDLAVTAMRGDTDASVVGVAHAHLRSAPQARATIELESGEPIDFIPTNRTATVRFAQTADHGRLTLLPLDGVYETSAVAGGTAIRGVKGAAGFVALRFGYRVDPLPASLASTDLAVIEDPVQRPLKEANVPTAIGASALSTDPIVELLCGGDSGQTRTIKPGVAAHIPFSARDTCRIVFHRERLAPENGAQRLSLEVNVTRVDGETRPEAHVAQSVILRPGPQPRYAWIKGVIGTFDHITVRISHDVDEAGYVGADDLRTGEPAAQWSVVAGEGVARIYATASIPTGLYRVSDRAHSGILSLNLGVIARLTWLDSEGHGGFLGVEGGVMGVGLANDVSAPPNSQSLTQVSTVAGIGLSVPIANRSLATETSLNLHAWFEYEISRDLGNEPGSPFGFVFGPSISVGNVGANL
jgi:hypothetical protein